jgi:hypothetical protein
MGRAPGGCRANGCRRREPLADYVARAGDRWARGIDPTLTLDANSLTVLRQTYPGRGGLFTKETKGRQRPVPIIEPLRATLQRHWWAGPGMLVCWLVLVEG